METFAVELTKQEALLIETLRTVRFGELYAVKLAPGQMRGYES